MYSRHTRVFSVVFPFGKIFKYSLRQCFLAGLWFENIFWELFSRQPILTNFLLLNMVSRHVPNNPPIHPAGLHRRRKCSLPPASTSPPTTGVQKFCLPCEQNFFISPLNFYKPTDFFYYIQLKPCSARSYFNSHRSSRSPSG